MTDKNVIINIKYEISGLSNDDVAKIIQTISETEETLEDFIDSTNDYTEFKIIVEKEYPQ